MDVKQQKILDSSYHLLVEVDAQEILAYLKCLTGSIKDQVMTTLNAPYRGGNKLAMMRLLDSLRRRPEGFQQLVNGLRELHQDGLADKLDGGDHHDRITGNNATQTVTSPRLSERPTCRPDISLDTKWNNMPVGVTNSLQRMDGTSSDSRNRLAEHIGFENEEYDLLKNRVAQKDSLTVEIVKQWNIKAGAITLRQLYEALHRIDRPDIISDIEEKTSVQCPFSNTAGDNIETSHDGQHQTTVGMDNAIDSRDKRPVQCTASIPASSPPACSTIDRQVRSASPVIHEVNRADIGQPTTHVHGHKQPLPFYQAQPQFKDNDFPLNGNKFDSENVSKIVNSNITKAAMTVSDNVTVVSGMHQPTAGEPCILEKTIKPSVELVRGETDVCSDVKNDLGSLEENVSVNTGAYSEETLIKTVHQPCVRYADDMQAIVVYEDMPSNKQKVKQQVESSIQSSEESFTSSPGSQKPLNANICVPDDKAVNENSSNISENVKVKNDREKTLDFEHNQQESCQGVGDHAERNKIVDDEQTLVKSTGDVHTTTEKAASNDQKASQYPSTPDTFITNLPASINNCAMRTHSCEKYVDYSLQDRLHQAPKGINIDEERHSIEMKRAIGIPHLDALYNDDSDSESDNDTSQDDDNVSIANQQRLNLNQNNTTNLDKNTTTPADSCIGQATGSNEYMHKEVLKLPERSPLTERQHGFANEKSSCYSNRNVETDVDSLQSFTCNDDNTLLETQGTLQNKSSAVAQNGQEHTKRHDSQGYLTTLYASVKDWIK